MPQLPRLSLCLSVSLSFCLSVSLSLCLFVSVSVCRRPPDRQDRRDQGCVGPGRHASRTTAAPWMSHRIVGPFLDTMSRETTFQPAALKALPTDFAPQKQESRRFFSKSKITTDSRVCRTGLFSPREKKEPNFAIMKLALGWTFRPIQGRETHVDRELLRTRWCAGLTWDDGASFASNTDRPWDTATCIALSGCTVLSISATR